MTENVITSGTVTATTYSTLRAEVDAERRSAGLHLPLGRGEGVEKIALTITQPVDDMSEGGDLDRNTLTLTTMDAGAGPYLVLDGRWALDATEIAAFADRLRAVLEFAEAHQERLGA